jgi:hypothetical protein
VTLGSGHVASPANRLLLVARPHRDGKMTRRDSTFMAARLARWTIVESRKRRRHPQVPSLSMVSEAIAPAASLPHVLDHRFGLVNDVVSSASLPFPVAGVAKANVRAE